MAIAVVTATPTNPAPEYQAVGGHTKGNVSNTVMINDIVIDASKPTRASIMNPKMPAANTNGTIASGAPVPIAPGTDSMNAPARIAAHSRRRSRRRTNRMNKGNNEVRIDTASVDVTSVRMCGAPRNGLGLLNAPYGRGNTPVTARVTSDRATKSSPVTGAAAQPNSTSRATSGSRMVPAMIRLHETIVAGHVRRTYGSSAR